MSLFGFPRLSEAFYIGAATALSYVYAFQYEAGYLRFFGLPRSLVTVSPERLIIIFITSLTIVIFLQYLADTLISLTSAFWQNDNRARILRLHLRGNEVTLFFFVLAITFLFLQSRLAFVFFIGSLISAAIFYLLPYFFRKEATYTERLRAAANDDIVEARKATLSRIAIKYGRGVIIVYLMITVPPGLFYGIGYLIARMDSTRMVAEADGKQWILVRSFGSRFILAEFDEPTGTLTNEFRIITDSEVAGYDLRLVVTPRLQRAPVVAGDNNLPKVTP